MQKIAAIYARVSSDKQKEDNTIASQTAALMEFAERHDYRVSQEMMDTAVRVWSGLDWSGYAIFRRKGELRWCWCMRRIV